MNLWVPKRIENVLEVGAGAQFHWVQDAVDYASVKLDDVQTVIKIAPHIDGKWNEDVLVRKDKIHLDAMMPGGPVDVKSVTMSDCTEASIALFNATNDRTLLVRDPALGTHYPRSNTISGLRIARDTNLPVWGTGAPGGDEACSSVRFLGSNTDNSEFGIGTLGLLRCFLDQAAGCKPGFGGVFACMTDNVGMHQGIGSGGLDFRQVNQEFVFQSNIIGNTRFDVDLTTPGIRMPGDKRNVGPVWMEGFSFGIYLTGPDARIGPPPPDFGFMCGPRCFLLQVYGPTAAVPSLISGMTVREVLQVLTGDVTLESGRFLALGVPNQFVVGIGGSAAICRWNGGRYMELPVVDAGPPASQFIETVGFGS